MSQPVARFLVFFTSAAVLVLEILAMRLLAPYLGVSLGVFTGVIGVILAGIALGAWWGGRAADRSEPVKLIGPMLVAGGLTAMASPLIINWVGPALSNDAVSIVIAATVGFLVPAALLSTIPPLVVKARLVSLSETGSVVGSYSAVGTAGAIFGTFITGFFLVARFPSSPTVAVTGALLVLVGAVLWVKTWRAAATLIAAVGLLAVLVAGTGPCETETQYHCVIVAHDDDPATGRTLILDRLHNSYVDLADPTYLRFRYIQLMADIIEASVEPGPIGTVSIGGGGMTLPGYVEATRPGSTNVALEIDGGVVEVARAEMGLSDQIEVLVGDARLTLPSLAESSADVVIGDAFSGASVPWHLTTVEYLQEISRVLTPGGVYTINVIDFDRLEFVRSTAATLAAVFDHVAVFAPPTYLDGSTGGNFVLAASDRPLSIDAILQRVSERGGTEVALTGDQISDFSATATILTDEFAPVDQMLGSPRRD